MGARQAYRRTVMLAAATAVLLPLGLVSPAATSAATSQRGHRLPGRHQRSGRQHPGPGLQQRRHHHRGRGRGRELRRHRRLVLRRRAGRGRAQRRASRCCTTAWPSAGRTSRPAQPDNVVADGQTVAVAGTGTVLGVIGASAYGEHQRHVHRELRRRQHQHRHASRSPTGSTPAPPAGTDTAGHDRRLEHRGGTHPGQPVLRGHPADRRPAGRLGDAAVGRRGRRQERPVHAHLQPHDRLARPPRPPARPAPPPTTTRPARTASAPPAEHRVQGLVHGRRRHAVRRLRPDDRQHRRQEPGPDRHRARASPRCSRAT